jgi:hypothetical protein
MTEGKVMLGLILVTIFQLQPALASDRVFIFINATEQDQKAHGNPTIDEQQIGDILSKQFPQSKMVVIRANSNDEVKEKLNSKIGPGTAVDGLYIMSHGRSEKAYSPNPVMKFPNNITFQFNSEIYNENENFSVNLRDESSVRSVFGPLVGKFSDHAKIIMSGCKTVGVGNETEKLLLMNKIADNFGLESGSIYMNSEFGSEIMRILSKQLTLDMPNNNMLVLHALMNVFSPIVYPVFYVGDYFVFNQGYLMRKKKDKSELFRDDFFNARSQYESLGEKESPSPLATYYFPRISDHEMKKDQTEMASGSELKRTAIISK